MHLCDIPVDRIHEVEVRKTFVVIVYLSCMSFEYTIIEDTIDGGRDGSV